MTGDSGNCFFDIVLSRVVFFLDVAIRIHSDHMTGSEVSSRDDSRKKKRGKAHVDADEVPARRTSRRTGKASRNSRQAVEKASGSSKRVRKASGNSTEPVEKASGSSKRFRKASGNSTEPVEKAAGRTSRPKIKKTMSRKQNKTREAEEDEEDEEAEEAEEDEEAEEAEEDEEAEEAEEAEEGVHDLSDRAITVELPKGYKDVRKMTKKEYENLRWGKNPYESAADNESLIPKGFRTFYHGNIYNNVLIPLKEKVAPQKAIDFQYIQERKDKFGDIPLLCELYGLLDIMEFGYYYEERVIMQFYATLYIDDKDPHEKFFYWMTGSREFKGSLSQFAEALGIDKPKEGHPEFIRLHDDVPKKPSDLRECYRRDQKDVVYGNIGNLLPMFDVLQRLFRWTLFPKVGDSSNIRGYLKNLLWHIAKQDKKPQKIDVMDLLYQEIRMKMVDRRKSLVYAPFIQAFIDKVTKARFDVEDHAIFIRRPEKHQPAEVKPLKGNKRSLTRRPRDYDRVEIEGTSVSEQAERQRKIIRRVDEIGKMLREDRKQRQMDHCRIKANTRMLLEIKLHLKMISQDDNNREAANLGIVLDLGKRGGTEPEEAIQNEEGQRGGTEPEEAISTKEGQRGTESSSSSSSEDSQQNSDSDDRKDSSSSSSGDDSLIADSPAAAESPKKLVL